MRKPVSADEACGPDLDLAGDPDYLQTVGRIEGLLPSAYFSRDDEGRLVPFDRATIDFAAEFRRLDKLLEATRDLRLLTIYGRLTALSRDLAGLSASFRSIAVLLRDNWDDVHPKGEDEDYLLRTAVLQALDDMPTVVLPLQHITLVDSRRHGPLTFRTLMVANGEVAGRDDEPAIDRGMVDRALTEADLGSLKETRDRLVEIRDASRVIQTTTRERAGHEQAVSLDRVPDLVNRMLLLIEPPIVARDPASAETTMSGPASGSGLVHDAGSLPDSAEARSTGRIGNHAQAALALAAAASYLRRLEPSSPAELLVRQAGSLIGKSFVDVIRALVPAHADQATIAIGADRAFELSLDQLQAASEPSDDGWDPEGSGTETSPEDVTGQEQSLPRVSTRAAAVSLLQQVTSFFRAAEPSSPIPLLLERASILMERDFLTILRDVLPKLTEKDT